MDNQELEFEQIVEYIKNKKVRDFKNAIEELEYVDIASLIDGLEDNYQVIAFRMLPKDCAADVFSYLPIDSQEQIISNITDKEINYIIEDLYVDDAVDLLDELPAIMVEKILSNAKPETRKILNQFLKYADDTAGSVMTNEYIDLKKKMTVIEALKRIRNKGQDKEDIYTCYVTDSSRHLEGVITAKTLLLSDDEILIEELMDDNFIFCNTNDDKEEVSKLMQKYDLLSLPVVDKENRLVGIITIDDAVDIIQEEVEEDFEKMAAILPSDKPYLDMSVFSLYKNRILWLFILMVTGMIIGGILESFEAAIASLPLLVSFVPMLTGTGGNSGAQSATMCIRGLTTGEITSKDWLKVWWKEFRVSILVSISLAIFNFARIMILQDDPIDMKLKYSLVVCLALIFTVILAKSIGALLPLVVKKLKLDPAVCASPIITTIVDCCSILIYFAIACTVFSNILG